LRTSWLIRSLAKNPQRAGFETPPTAGRFVPDYVRKYALVFSRTSLAAIKSDSPRRELADSGALFRELKPQVGAFLAAYDKQTAAALNLGKQAVIGGGVASQQAFDEYQAQWGPELENAHEALRTAVGKLLEEIMGVEARQ
jgi:hypothetical protein